MGVSRFLLLAAVAGLLAVSAPVVADHVDNGFRFDHRGGNEWWVEVRVTVDGQTQGVADEVWARDDGGSWKALELRSWGNWAGSFHIEPGHRVQFKAVDRSEFGNEFEVLSCWFTHPGGVEECEETPPPSEDFEASFSGASGNDWWIQVKVAASEPLAGVDARLDGGAWKALTLRSWGAWAASYHAPEGTIVQFRARAESGAEALSGCYRWTAATSVPCGEEPPPPPPPGEFDASFEDVEGNKWWIEVEVDANEPLAGVDTRLDGGAWKPLTLRSWGDWAASYSAPEGTIVQFRARSTSGAEEISGCWRWTAATPVACDDSGGGTGAVWPREGSFVLYRYERSFGLPDGSVREDETVDIRFRYVASQWEAVCEGKVTTETDGNVETSSWRVKAAFEPPTMPTDVAVGDTVESSSAMSCDDASGDPTRVEGQTTYAARKNGAPVAAPAWQGVYENDCNCQGGSAEWHTTTGLVLAYNFAGRLTGETLRLVDTDAPIATGDPAPTPPPAPAWPKDGSFVKYTVRGDSEWSTVFGNATFTYRDGAWTATCSYQSYGKDGSDWTETRTWAEAPPRGPLAVASGNLVEVDPGVPCVIGDGDVTIAKGTFSHKTVRNGAAVTTTVWWADEHPDGAGDDDVWWDTDTGLVLQWELDTDSGGRYVGRLTDTNAPLG